MIQNKQIKSIIFVQCATCANNQLNLRIGVMQGSKLNLQMLQKGGNSMFESPDLSFVRNSRGACALVTRCTRVAL